MALTHLKTEFGAHGLHLDDDVEEFIERGTVRAIERCRITSRTCRRCGRLLTDPESMKAGIGPECISLEVTEAALEAAYPAGTIVRFIAGPEAGKVGKVLGVKRGRPRPIQVWVANGWYATWASADQVESIGGAA